MSNPETTEQPEFNTNFRYAIIAGWLILPFLNMLFALINNAYALTETSVLHTSYYMVYIEYILFTLFYCCVLYIWVKRKKILPVLMIIHFAIIAAYRVSALSVADKANWVHLALAIVWIVYFIRSKRVKATFVN